MGVDEISCKKIPKRLNLDELDCDCADGEGYRQYPKLN